METWVFTNRWTGAPLGQAEAETRKEALEKLVESGANLIGADLFGANLSGANLSGANLSEADLSGAYLSGANLSEADLSGAYLSGANLSGADLSRANLNRAYLSGANLSRANLNRAYLSGAKGLPLLVVPKLHTLVFQAVGAEGEQLEMGQWHTCQTTHCRGGHAILAAGEKGSQLESIYDSYVAATLIYLGTYPDEPPPDFYASNEAALADIKACAEREAATV